MGPSAEGSALVSGTSWAQDRMTTRSDRFHSIPESTRVLWRHPIPDNQPNRAVRRCGRVAGSHRTALPKAVSGTDERHLHELCETVLR